jgi:hypothetical protein
LTDLAVHVRFSLFRGDLFLRVTDQFAAAVWGNSLGDWLCAAELVLAGVRTCLIPSSFPQEEYPPFPEICFSPSSSEIIANRFGFSPQTIAEESFEPDFQVVTPQHRIDFFGNDEEFKFGLQRDVSEHAGNTNELFRELDTLAREFEEWLGNASGYPPLSLRKRLQWRLLSARMPPAKFLQPFSEILEHHRIPLSLQVVLQAPLNMFSPYPAEKLPAARAACLWRFLRRVSGNGSLREDIRGPLSEIISANGEVVSALPAGVSISGKRICSLKLSDNREIEFQALLARPGEFFSVLDPDQRELRVAKKIAGYFPRYAYHTLFFRLERDAVPEAMARRVIFVLSTKKPLWGDNLMLLSRFARVPRRDTLAVTLGYSKGDMEPPPPDFIFESLQSLMPFLRTDQLELDEGVSLRSQKYYLPARGLLSGTTLAMPLQNLFLSFSEILPRLGPMAIFIAARGLADMLKSGQRS